ncbi:MAG: type IV-A pilus assembly ATPase PilB [Methylophaga sp.]|uniref:type IV-A pilus assembly ATPase PilB n=1 Tax=Methylophaga sp. UBA678 TaxID=1946901 RepID=UPI000C690C4D|nr:type IV-A pilus assembly ATPase PilB [Methylophaga sp. UBA678]MAX52990.1 type IV-A pilus assembly ATPase PilB [Methylophaga sp.]|tara:strand:- start:19770 stop:21488 length:1719 start_codon:yes stop_codon:yes gene_type:complete
MANMAAPMRLSGLARRLVNEGLLTEEQALHAQSAAKEAKQPFVTYLVNHKILASADIAAIASQEFGVPLFDIDAMNLDLAATSLIQEKLIRQHNALPLFQRGKRLYVAVSDPTNLQALDEFQFNTAMNTFPVLVDEQKLSNIIEKALDKTNEKLDNFDDEELDDIDLGPDEDADKADQLNDKNIDDTPVVRFINGILTNAIKSGASDIHFEPYEQKYRVRVRIDGMLHEMKTAPVALGGRIAARLKVLSRLNIAERRVPQDGRMRLKMSKNKAIDFRVNTCPTLFGEKIVLRILDPTSAQLGIDALGYEENQKKTFLEIMHKPYGMVLVTGPTGSGKTVSLYTALNILNTGDRNISTAEDPAEISLPGINQVNVHPAIGLTFSEALRAFLRQDPDVIMVGEIRDLETAEIAIKAAQTGHMVFSTLHTNDAPQSLTRLMNMGVPAFNIASAVSLIIAQRLARRLCSKCKAPETLPDEALLTEGFTQAQIDAGVTVYKAVGCDSCTEGYKGRVGIYQVMPVSEAMGRIIMEGGNAIQLADQAEKEGIDDLRKSGLKKVAAGLTSLEEVNRVIKE